MGDLAPAVELVHRTVVRRQALPSSRELRAAIPPRTRITRRGRALWLLGRFLALYALGLTLVVVPQHAGARLAGAALLGVMAAKLFEVAHEALHLNFTGTKRFDRWIARVTLLPTLQPLAPAIYAHVSRHHKFTNVRCYDTQWSPLTKPEYDALGPVRRGLERAYRSLLGLGLYWTIEVIARQLFTRDGMVVTETVRPPDASRAAFRRDRTLVLGYALVNLAGWPLLAPALGTSWWVALGCGFVIPTMIGHWLIGAVTFFQHTTETIPWYARPEDCAFFDTQVAGTEELIAPNLAMAVLVSRERPHTAHHVDMTIPAYGLREAQDALDARYPAASPKQTLSWRVVRQTLARCKLYDYEARRWLDHAGRPTG